MVDGLNGGNAKPDLSVGANSPSHELKRSSDWSENAMAACGFSIIGQSEAISLLVTRNAPGSGNPRGRLVGKPPTESGRHAVSHKKK
jgi:hypothetical protein